MMDLVDCLPGSIDVSLLLKEGTTPHGRINVFEGFVMSSKIRHSLFSVFVGVLALIFSITSIDKSLALEPVEVASLLATDSVAGDAYGYSVAVNGDTIVIGAPRADFQSGSVSVFRLNGTTWVLQAKLTASDRSWGDQYGKTVAVDGDIIVVGAYGDDPSGSVYTYKWNGTRWVEMAKLTPSDGGSNGQRFGESIAIDGNTLIVGSQGDDDLGLSSGAAYVFKWDGTNWVEQIKLTASDGTELDGFGHSVALNEDTAVIGAPGDDDLGGGSGAAYIFKWDGTNWVQQTKLTASDGTAADMFGQSVSVNRDSVVIGVPQDDDLGNKSGSAYLFLWDGTNWVEQTKLTASDGTAVDHFGQSVAVGGDIITVGAYNNVDFAAGYFGSVYVFVRNGMSWVEQATMRVSDNLYTDTFGWSIAMDGYTVVIGATNATWQESTSGLAYVFSLLSNDTLPGEDVLVLPPPEDENGNLIEDAPDISLKFGDIEEGGETNVVITDPGPGSTAAPSGFRITGFRGKPLLFDIETTATLADGSTFEVCIDYSAFDIAGDPSNLTLSHEVDGRWVDITTSNDTSNMILCGTTDSFSYFAILEAGLTTISCLAPNGGLSIDGHPFTVLVQGQSEEFQVQPEGSIANLWSCGWPEGCKWLQYQLRAGSAWNIVTAEGGMLIMERAAQEPVPEFVLQWGSFGSVPGAFNTPHGVEADYSGYIYVTERGNHRVQKFDAEGNFVQSFGSFGSGPGQFILPNEMAIDSFGDLYISDEGNCRIQKLDNEGEFISQWGSCGGGPGQFSLNWGIAIDSNDQVFVADTFNYRIQVFDNEGNYLREWGTQGTGDGEFEAPRGIAIDPMDNVIVVDEGNHRIQKFENDGTYLTQWGSFGSTNGEFTWPHSAATDIVGNVFVGDVGNPWVQKFDKDGNFLVRWGSHEEFSGEQPGIEVSPNGLIYVGDIHTSRIRVYGTKAEIVIEPGTGGEVETTDGQLNLTIPDDALTGSETISVVQSLPEESLVDVQVGESGGSGEILAAYDLKPDGLVFDNPVTLTMSADVTALNQDQRDAIDIYLYSDTNGDGNPDTFVALDATCHVSDGPVFVVTCTAEIAHFSTYGLIAPIDADRDGVADLFGGVEDQCSDTVIPESVPTKQLGTNRWALVDDDMVFDTKLPANDAPETPYTLAVTAGCSCEQIIATMELGSGHTKFGCSSGVIKEWISVLSQ
jgi:hypothetical protein